MIHEDIQFNKLLIPFSYLYGLGVGIRNKLFELKLLRSRRFDISIICVGNLAVGGTGKTPHIEYLIRLLRKDFHVAVLSRGYKRRTKGYLLASPKSKADEIGDEPYQIMKKFPDVRVAVDADRCRGIEELMQLREPPVDVILLDDAFQHRYVSAGLNILLTSCDRPFNEDKLLPAGRLREPIIAKERADVVVVTKCPDDIKPIDFNSISKGLDLMPYQMLFFSQFRYGQLYKLFNVGSTPKSMYLDALDMDSTVFLLTGIARPRRLYNRMREYVEKVVQFKFSDHHNFTGDDIAKLNKRFAQCHDAHKLVVTTEKDAARLRNRHDLSSDIKENLYVLPIRVTFLQDKEKQFNQIILDYVRENKRNRSIP